MFSVNIRAKSSCDILKSVGISRGIGIFFSPSTASKQLVAHRSSASADFGRFYNFKAIKIPENARFPGFSYIRTSDSKKITSTFSVSVTVAILISDTKCGIERNDFFIVLEAEVLGRELDRISRLVGVHIDL